MRPSRPLAAVVLIVSARIANALAQAILAPAKTVAALEEQTAIAARLAHQMLRAQLHAAAVLIASARIASALAQAIPAPAKTVAALEQRIAIAVTVAKGNRFSQLDHF